MVYHDTRKDYIGLGIDRSRLEGSPIILLIIVDHLGGVFCGLIIIFFLAVDCEE